MNPLLWLNSLVTFRKQGGGLAVPQLDADGRIRVSMLNSTPVVVSASPPAEVDGTSLWLNTNAGYEGVYFRDQTRGKWLSVAEVNYAFGHDNADNQTLRFNGQQTPQTGAGIRLPRDATIVAVVAHAADGELNKQLDLRVNAVSVLTTTLAAGAYSNIAVDVDAAAGDLLDVFAASPSGGVQDIAYDVFVRWRDS